MIIKEYKNYCESEILSLYSAVGWTAYTDSPEVLRRGFEKSLLSLGAYENERLLGLIRCVGDGETIVYVQDILVYPEHQRRGIGTALMRAALEHFGGVRQIVLATDREERTLKFYESLGFCPMDDIGCCGFMLAK